MKKLSVFVGMFILCMTLSTSNLYAAACSPTRGKVEVSQGTGSSCSSIQSAINAAGSTPAIISVLPGTYVEQITIPSTSNVTIVGSGQENTKITTTTTDYTLKSSGNTSIENIWVNNDNVGALIRYDAVLIDGGTMNIKNVKITMALKSWSTVYGIRNAGSVAPLSVTHSTIEIENKVGANGKYGIGVYGNGHVTISDSVINTFGIDAQWVVAVKGGMTIRDTVIRCDGSLYNDCIASSGEEIISNSSIEAIGQANAVENRVIQGGATITNSKLVLSGTPSADDCAVNGGQIGGSLIQGPICGTPKIVNSWDGNFAPIVYPPLP